jgi:hypothetical protein
MKPAILVTSHPNTEEKEYILRDFGNFISQYGIDHFLFTNFPANKSSQLEFKGYYFTTNNPKDPIPNVQWRAWVKFPEVKLMHNHFIHNWCFSGTNLMLEGLKYLKSLGYTHVYTFIYDTEPSFEKIKNFINLSNQTFTKGKKAIFYEYPLLDGHIKGLHNNIYSGELDFLVKIFEEMVQNYNPQNPYFNTNPSCENCWEYMTRPYQDLIEFLPNEQVIKSVYDSADFKKFPDGKEFWVGRYKGKTLFVTRKPLSNIKIFNSTQTEIEFKILFQQHNLIVIEFDSTLGEFYYIDNFLFLQDNENWRHTDNFVSLEP